MDRMQKKILILDTGKEWGGGTNSLLELLKRIDRKRYQFSALFYNNYGMGRGSDIRTEIEKLGVEFILRKNAVKKAYAKPLKEVARSVFFLTPTLKKRSVFYLDYKSRILPDSRMIEEVLTSGGFDLLYMNNQPSSNLEGLLAAGAVGIPCIQHSRAAARLNTLEAEAVNALASRVICVSKGVRDDLVNEGVRPEKCTVVYNGIDVSLLPKRSAEDIRRELGIRAAEPVTGTVGSLINRKRIDLLIDAVANLKDTGLKCIIVGEGPLLEELKKRAASLGIVANIIFTGFKEDALSYVNAMDVFVLPSEKEGLPRVVLEAMLSSKPVISFDVTGAKELVKNGTTGLLVKEGPADHTALAGAIRTMIADKTSCQTMGLAARERVVSEFGIDKYVTGVEKVFGEVLS